MYCPLTYRLTRCGVAQYDPVRVVVKCGYGNNGPLCVMPNHSLTNSFSLLQTETKNASIDAAEDAIGHDLIAAEDTASGVSFWDE